MFPEQDVALVAGFWMNLPFFWFSVSVYFFGVQSGVDKARCPLVELRVADLFLFVVIRSVFDKYFETRLNIICLKQ